MIGTSPSGTRSRAKLSDLEAGAHLVGNASLISTEMRSFDRMKIINQDLTIYTSRLLSIGLVLLATLASFQRITLAQGPSEAPVNIFFHGCLEKKFPNISRGGDGLTAFDPNSGRNFAWDKEKQAWIDIKTLECICPACSGKDDPKYAPVNIFFHGCLEGKFPNISRGGDGLTAFDPDSGRNFAWDKEKQAWIDIKTLECICPKCPSPSTAKPPPTPETSSVPEKTSPDEEYEKALELFGGGQYQRAPDEPVKNLYGVDTSLFYNVTPHVSIGGDFSFLFGSTSETIGTLKFDTTLHRQTYLFGPQFNFYPDDKVKIFVHPLFGVVHDTVKFDFGTTTTDSSASAFAMAFGGGMDIRVTPRVSFRVFEADYVPTHFGGEFQNNFRLSTGLVLRFGGK